CAAYVQSDVDCRAASCESGVATAAGACNGNGACEAPLSKNCSPFACSGDACATTCASDHDCADAYRCDTTSKKCISGASCDGDHTLTDAKGMTRDCSPYKCTAEGTCGEACSSAVDCVGGATCSAVGKCAAAPPAEPTVDGGCAFAVPTSTPV